VAESRKDAGRGDSSRKKSGIRKSIAVNRKARHEYSIDETFEAGLVLLGSEVKSLRAGQINFKDGYIRVIRGEAWLIGVHISPYVFSHQFNHDPERERKLLLHRRELDKLDGRSRERGLTLVPLQLYFVDGRVKLELGLARGKKDHDRREDLKARDAAREIAQAMKARR
jgi:SsrA-binding protein